MSLGVIRPQSCLSKKEVQINWQKDSKSALTGFWKLSLPTIEGGLNQETSPYFSESSKSHVNLNSLTSSEALKANKPLVTVKVCIGDTRRGHQTYCHYLV